MKTIKIKVDDSAYNNLYAKSLAEGVSVPALVRWALCLYLTATVQDVYPGVLQTEVQK